MLAFGLSSVLNPGDEILLSPFEHHANLLPWRRVAEERGAIVRTMPMTTDLMLDLDGSLAMMNERTKIVATTLVSNVLGTIIPVANLAERAHELGALVIVDAAQAAPHLPIDVNDLGADALVFSSHKCYGPAGIAALILSNSLIDTLEPMILGGGMVDSVESDGATWKSGPEKFEGGSPNVEGAIGFAAALKTINYANTPRAFLVHRLQSFPSIILFDPPFAVAIIAFTVIGLHPHDVADMLGQRGICIRAGNCCATPLVEKLSPNGILRVSLGRETTEEDVQKFIDELSTIISFTSI